MTSSTYVPLYPWTEDEREIKSRAPITTFGYTEFDLGHELKCLVKSLWYASIASEICYTDDNDSITEDDCESPLELSEEFKNATPTLDAATKMMRTSFDKATYCTYNKEQWIETSSDFSSDCGSSCGSTQESDSDSDSGKSPKNGSSLGFGCKDNKFMYT